MIYLQFAFSIEIFYSEPSFKWVKTIACASFYRMSMKVWLAILFIFAGLSASAQKNFLKAEVRDTAAKKNLHYSIAALISEKDSTLYRSIRTDETGQFEFEKITPGNYTLMISYPRLADYLQSVTITDTSKINLGRIDMVTVAVLMDEVIIRSGQPIRMRGDTLEYTADSFAVRPGANVQELLKRLPGIQVDRNGKITAQGKEVQKILVDGDEFFSDDPGLASQFLNADAVDKVQVFDKKSEATEFTGIDDGTRTKTINLKLKNNRKNGSFGKLSAGSDGKEYYNHEAMASLFSGSKKISVFGLASKTGKEGLGYNELSKYVGQDYELIDDGNGNSYSSSGEYENENYYGNGLPEVISGGAHYSNKWKEGKQKLFTNYRIKQIKATGWSTSNGTTVLPDGSSFYNQSASRESSTNFTQKANGNFTIPVDSFSTIKVSVNGSLFNGTNSSTRISSSKNGKGFLVNKSNQESGTASEGGKFASNISYQHKFRKEGRTLSLLAQQDYNRRTADNGSYTQNEYFDPASGLIKSIDTLNQLQKTGAVNKSFATKISATEMLSKRFRLFAEYGWKTSEAQNKFNTYDRSNGGQPLLLDSLSNNYDFIVNTCIAGSSIAFTTKKVNLTLGTKLYFTGFKQLNNDLKTESRRNFTNLAPQANFRVNLKPNSSISLRYSGQTFQPTADQLQPLRKSNNPLYVQIGNPNLLPGFHHNADLGYSIYNWVKGRNFYLSGSVDLVENNISSKTTTDAQNKTVTQYVNLKGVPSLNGSANYGWQYKKLHLRPLVFVSIRKYGNYTILNGATVKNETFNVSGNFTLRYNLENKLGAEYTARVIYARGRSDIAINKMPTTFSHVHDVNLTGYLPKKFELSSDCVFNFQPANGSFATNFNTIRWNASLVKRLLKNDKGVVKFNVNDILNGNTGYYRGVNGNNVYESDRFVIKRYFLLTLAWDFSKSIK